MVFLYTTYALYVSVHIYRDNYTQANVYTHTCTVRTHTYLYISDEHTQWNEDAEG